MKIAVPFVLLIIATSLHGCGKKTEEHSHPHPDQETAPTDPTKALYDSVMDVHDQVMPRMGEIIRLTESLKDKIAKTPDMPSAKKQEIETAIESLDKASEGMMDWMHKFSPETKATDSQAKRAYLNEEMIKVERVKSDILTALEKAKALQ